MTNEHPVRKACLEFHSVVNRTSNIVWGHRATQASPPPLTLRNAKYYRESGRCPLARAESEKTNDSMIANDVRILISNQAADTANVRSISWKIILLQNLVARLGVSSLRTFDESRKSGKFRKLDRHSLPCTAGTFRILDLQFLCFHNVRRRRSKISAICKDFVKICRISKIFEITLGTLWVAKINDVNPSFAKISKNLSIRNR